MKRSYTDQQRRKAIEVYKRTQSVTKTTRQLGYPGRWTLYKWLREPTTPGRPRKQAKTLTCYPFEVKLRAVELFNAGWSPADIAQECGLRSKMSVYSWAQRHREEGQWGLMSKKEREERARIPTRAALEKSLPDDPSELKEQMAKLLVEKAVLEKELELVKKTSASSQVSSVIDKRPQWLTRYALTSPCRCCLPLSALHNRVFTTTFNNAAGPISTSISVTCSMPSTRSRTTRTAIDACGRSCVIVGSSSARRLFVAS